MFFKINYCPNVTYHKTIKQLHLHMEGSGKENCVHKSVRQNVLNTGGATKVVG